MEGQVSCYEIEQKGEWTIIHPESILFDVEKAESQDGARDEDIVLTLRSEAYEEITVILHRETLIKALCK